MISREVEIDDYTVLHCGGCGRTLPASEFHRSNRRKSGRGTRCKPCAKQYSDAYYQVNRQNVIARQLRSRKSPRAQSFATPDALTRDLSRKWHEARGRATTRGWEFNIQRTDLLALYNAQGGCCAISGRRLAVASRRRRDPDGISIDRIDCGRGYCLNNIRIVTTRMNYLLGTWGLQALLDHCQEILAYQKGN